MGQLIGLQLEPYSLTKYADNVQYSQDEFHLSLMTFINKHKRIYIVRKVESITNLWPMNETLYNCLSFEYFVYILFD